MAEINLTEEDMLTLQRCLNEGMEPPRELAQKLFPSMYASFDFKTLKDSKIPTIEYQGKRTEAAILSEAAIFGGGSHLQLERSFDGGRINKSATQLQLFEENTAGGDANWRNLIVQGDNLQFLKTCFLNQDPIIKDRVKGKVRLVYSEYLNKMFARWTSLNDPLRDWDIFCNYSFCLSSKINFAFWLFRGILITSFWFGGQYTLNRPIYKYFYETLYYSLPRHGRAFLQYKPLHL
ncbi:MAG: hypothetical protein Q8P24_03160 [Desulfobacterales bacterium]|nr:hypothetical protein [Desulfobacterales bacterium]